MTPRIKERWINAGISFVTVIGGVVLAFTLTSGENRALRINNNLGKKADLEYVDKQDDALEKKIDKNEVDHDKIHEVTDKYLERIMDFWDIRYEDLKEQIKDDER